MNTILVREGGMTLRTFSLLKGLPVVDKNGEKIGMVNDLCISEAGIITGLVVQKQRLFKKNVYVALDNVSSFGPDGVIVSGEFEEQIPEVDMLLNKDAMLGRMMLSEMGEELGLLQDVCFLEKMGTIVAYETTDGFFSKNKLIHSEEPPICGKDAIIVSVSKQ
ncbi:PRC-barrel domain-containing protein [Peribacillus asahii]|uniref:PRC-barrel domain-containing protein n=1 Tax=Peribacillus asahii TaxID=228899 RepID=UPI00207A7D58|nr:PRC-barrel domain-containing protein [Peribacillus asahii]USK58901.1 PRC-barrel domain-containing protein [Peribacillus asahii]